MLVTFGQPGRGLALEVGRQRESARLAHQTGLPAQCWSLDKERRLVPLGHGLKSKAALSGKPSSALAVDADEDDCPVVLLAADQGSKWKLGANGTLSADVNGAIKFVGHDGSGPETGAHLLMVDERSDRKLKWKFTTDLK